MFSAVGGSCFKIFLTPNISNNIKIPLYVCDPWNHTNYVICVKFARVILSINQICGIVLDITMVM